MSAEDPVAALRGASLRVTKQRIAVLVALGQHPHADAEQLVRLVREDLGSVSTQAVYDVLTALSEALLVRRIETGPRALFELRAHAHDHVLCRECGALADVEPGVTPRTLPQAHGFRVDETEVLHRGLCPSCRPRVPLP
ncbi:Fur family transcriptional regulator [Lentzea sp. NPDC058436]|uniref:Fur family transcriptional regulator n=1 Tax=Lentzea sp. NPDC058436 TaxID=3346499 RepID=UPI003651D095